jgi:arylsulfatase A-like enzyme
MLSRRGVLFGAPYVLARAAKPQRNVLFLAIDDLNDWVGCLGGYPGVITPNIDNLARQGVNFRSAHCAAPLCNPARTAILTGRHPSSTGVYQNDQRYHDSPALEGAVTLNQHFKNNGYVTIGAGKIYHGTFGQFADRTGWDDYAQPTDRMRLPKPGLQAGSGAQGNFDYGPTSGGDEEMHDFAVTSWVEGHLRRKQPAPMFLACGITRPHLPWYVPKKYFDLYPIDQLSLPLVKEDDLSDIPPIGQRMALQNNDHKRITGSETWKRAVQAYLASITFADAMVGKVLRALESGPHAKNTTVVLWSDHGWHLGEKNHWRKFTLWERSTRNLLVIKSPGVTVANTNCDAALSMVHLYPTLCRLENLPKPPSPLDGVSFLPLLANPKGKWRYPALTTYGYKNHAIRTGSLQAGYRYIRYSDGTEELYDHSKDPNEWVNLAADPAFAARKKELAAWLPAEDAPDVARVKPGPTDV